jgi:hypothetical protein
MHSEHDDTHQPNDALHPDAPLSSLDLDAMQRLAETLRTADV